MKRLLWFLLASGLMFAQYTKADVTVSNAIAISCGDSMFKVSFMANGSNNLETECIQNDVSTTTVKTTIDTKATNWEKAKADANQTVVKNWLSGNTWLVKSVAVVKP